MVSVSVVVPALNAARTLPRCLSALAGLEPAAAEIVLVDNGSTDGTLALLQDFARQGPAGRIHVLQEARRGAAAARNAGIRAAQGDIIAFTDADCVPETDWLQPLLDPFADPRIGAVAGRVVAAPAASTLELFSGLFTLRSPQQPSHHQRWTPWEGGFPTANLAVRRSILETIRGFDEPVRVYGEDYDLCARIYAQGFGIEYVPTARVAHHHRTTFSGLARQAFGFGRAHPYLLRRHARRGLWLELPLRSFACNAFPGPVWIDLRSADKKILLVLALSCVVPAALWLLLPYMAWLIVSCARRARSAGHPVHPTSATALAGLLVLKSAALTAGRWWGSVRYGRLCF